MSERWKYQIRLGLFWSLFMILFIALSNEKSINEQINSKFFYLRIIGILIVGIFIMGYLSWLGQNPENNKWSNLFKKNKK
jgi:hypothetical protein